MADTRRLAAVRTDDHDLAESEGHRLLDDPALLILGGIRLGVALGDVDARDDDRVRAWPHFLHAATLAPVLAGDDHYLVALAQPDACHLEDLRRERDDLHEVPLAELARDGSEDARPARLVLRVEQYGGVVVETDERPVIAAGILCLAGERRPHAIAFLDAGVRDGVLHRRDEHIADLRRRTRRRAQ